MEALEDRRMLAVTVGNQTDVVNAPNLTSITALVANDGGDGISLREAIVAANNTNGSDVIDFAPGVQGSIRLTNGQLDVTDGLTIHGPGQGKLTVSGSGLSRVFDVNDTSLAVSQLTIADGHAVFDGATLGDGGGGIRANGSDVSLEHVILESNRFEGGSTGNMTGGGAIRAVAASNVSLDHVTARNNEAVNLVDIGLGGAISIDSSSLYVSHSDFEGNRIVDASDAWGGAIGSRSSQTVVTNSRFNGNQADGNDSRGRGGAIMATTGGSLDVDHSIFLGNSSAGATAQGGAIVAFQGVSSTISNSQFVYNSAVGDTAQGGAIWNSRGFFATMAIDNSSIVNNWAEGSSLAQGGGIFNGGDIGGTAITIDNSSIVNNGVSSDVLAQGGGIYNGDSFIIPFFGPATLTLTNTNVNANRANGVGDDANGVGGGIFNRPMHTVSIDESSNIHGNKASTSHDDVFGNLTLLNDLLALI